MTKITDLLGIKYPIFQGGMARISLAPLVAAVGEAGGIGFITAGGMTAAEVRTEINKTRELTEKPFGVNCMLMNPHTPEIIDVIIEEGIKVITTGAGTPKPYMEKLKAAGVKVFSVVPSVKLAKKMEELGVDGVIAEGTESGGHVGETTTMALVPQVVSAVNIPVLAAGGIADGRGMAAAFALGAVGIQMGTVFLTTEECPVHENFKKAVLNQTDTDTTVTGRSLGAPVRSIKNAMISRYLEMEESKASRDELEELSLGSLYKAVVEGKVDEGSVMSGQIGGMIKEKKSVEQVITEIVNEAKETINALHTSPIMEKELSYS
ncbi:NAD(P)H-dependent flavin oxidoreductase [Oceanobacillus saliphilus]|uniref:NAD(P)H-dependent flavin oxidoreductase n=1 Tax=Oceanobacillus saliphilus TaxID=2925834 RepID=UPI00201D30F0|nr:DUF561 domain-containing protein [Oceanobacillus saliphilus]